MFRAFARTKPQGAARDTSTASNDSGVISASGRRAYGATEEGAQLSDPLIELQDQDEAKQDEATLVMTGGRSYQRSGNDLESASIDNTAAMTAAETAEGFETIPPSASNVSGMTEEEGDFVGARTPTPKKSPRFAPGTRLGGISPSRLSDVATIPSPTSLATIEVKHTKQRSSPITGLLMSKPFVGGMAIYALLASGGAGWLLSRALKIPGLDSQIKALEQQVDELSYEVDRLEEIRKNLTFEVDRLGGEVDELRAINEDLGVVRDDLQTEVGELGRSVDFLNTTVDDLHSEVDRLENENLVFGELNKNLTSNNAEFARQNEELEKSARRFEELNGKLADENENLADLNDALNSTNKALSRLNGNLNTTVQMLLSQLGDLRNLTEGLRGENQEFDRLNDLLQNQTEQLFQTNANLNAELELLNDEVVSLKSENEKFSELNSDLTTIVTFLNVTADGIEQSFDTITKFLAQEIAANRNAVLDGKYNTYTQRIISWQCPFQSLFSSDKFASDYSRRIGDLDDYTRVMDYIDEVVLTEVCVERDDFELFLAVEVATEDDEPLLQPSYNSTMGQIIRSVVKYSTVAFDYYFPDEDENGLDSQVWVNADFDCAKLPKDVRFNYYNFTGEDTLSLLEEAP